MTSENHPLFTSYNSNINSQEDIIDSRLQKRQQDFNNIEDFSQIKENTISSELSLGENSRNLIFKQKRLKHTIRPEITQSLKNNLSIPLDWYEQCLKTDFNINNLPQIFSNFKTNSDIKQKFLCLVGIRKLLLLENFPLQYLINEGIINLMIQILDLNSNPEFQFESILCLNYISTKASENDCYLIVKEGIKSIIKLLESEYDELRLETPLLVGNLVLDSSKIRNILIKEKIFDKLLIISGNTNNKNLIKNCTWAVSNFFRIKPLIAYDLAKKSIQIIAKNLLFLENDYDFLSDACFILCSITENYKQGIKDLMEYNILSKIIQFLDCNVTYVQITCLRLVGNIASGNANQTQKLIDLGLLEKLKKLIFNQKKSLRKESAWILSNIAAGTQKQVETLISENFLPIFEKSIKLDEREVKNECIWAVCNLTNTKDNFYVNKILEQNILEIIKMCLNMGEAKIVAVNLEALNNLLIFGKENEKNGINPVVEEIGRLGMFDILENLQTHPVEVVYEKVIKLLEQFFDIQYNE